MENDGGNLFGLNEKKYKFTTKALPLSINNNVYSVCICVRAQNRKNKTQKLIKEMKTDGNSTKILYNLYGARAVFILLVCSFSSLDTE